MFGETTPAPELSATSPAESFRGRVLALDVGSRRVGIALSDPLGILAQPLLTLHRTTERADVRSIARLVRRHEVVAVVIGDPVHLSGDSSPQSLRVRQFAEALRPAIAVPMHFLDERLTTAEAHQLLDGTRRRPASRTERHERERVVDQIAAVLLLTAFLGARSPALLPPPEP